MMSQTRPGHQHDAKVSGHASFLHRASTPRQRLTMAMADSLTAFFGVLLRLGGRPLQNVLVSGLGALAYRVSPGRRRVALINLDLVYGDTLSQAEKTRIVKAHLYSFCRGFLDFMYDRVYWPRERVAAAAITPEARARMAELSEMPSGSAVVSCHLGNPELLLRLLTESGYDGYALYKGMKSPWFDRYVGRKRLRAGAGLIEIPSSRHTYEDGQRVKHEAHSLRTEVESIWARGSGIGFVADQHTRSGMRINVLGVENTPTQVGAWRYVVENRIPFLLHVAVYQPDGGISWHCSDIFHIEDQGSPEQTLVHYLQAANDWFESMIHRYPEQYFWSHRRFDRRHYKANKAKS